MGSPALQVHAWPCCAKTGAARSSGTRAPAPTGQVSRQTRSLQTLHLGAVCPAARSAGSHAWRRSAASRPGKARRPCTLQTLRPGSHAPGPHTAPGGTPRAPLASPGRRPTLQALRGARLAPLTAGLAGQVGAQALHQAGHQRAAARGRAVGVRAARARRAQAARRAEQCAGRRLQRLGARGRRARVAQLVQRRKALRLGALDGRRAGRAWWSALRGALATGALLHEALCAAGTAVELPGGQASGGLSAHSQNGFPFHGRMLSREGAGGGQGTHHQELGGRVAGAGARQAEQRRQRGQLPRPEQRLAQVQRLCRNPRPASKPRSSGQQAGAQRQVSTHERMARALFKATPTSPQLPDSGFVPLSIVPKGPSEGHTPDDAGMRGA